MCRRENSELRIPEFGRTGKAWDEEQGRTAPRFEVMNARPILGLYESVSDGRSALSTKRWHQDHKASPVTTPVMSAECSAMQVSQQCAAPSWRTCGAGCLAERAGLRAAGMSLRRRHERLGRSAGCGAGARSRDTRCRRGSATHRDIDYGAGARNASTSSRPAPVFRTPCGTPSGATSRSPAFIGSSRPSSRKRPSPSSTW